jgi:hypothetical protein
MSDARPGDEHVIVCERADAAMTVAGSKFDRRCVECGELVMIAPSGQALLRSRPNSKVLCLPCFLPLAHTAKEARFIDADGTLTDDVRVAAQQLRGVIPNMRRRRN